LFRDLPPAEFAIRDADADAALTALGLSMVRPPVPDKKVGDVDPEENPTIPAGYTYFGQFIDHDITFDPASSLDRFNDPDALQDFRTPRLDLDSVYGSGPDDQPFLYDEDGAHLLLGDFPGGEPHGFDLPRNRNADGIPRHALIGDKRNDENIIVSQLHATMLRFHNAVLDRILATGVPKPRAFLLAQQTVRWHYQWIVLHDFLPRIVGREIYERIFTGGRDKRPVLNLYKPGGRYAFIPVEFSVAAYRYGHSQVRPSYALNRIVGGGSDARSVPIDNFGGTGMFFRVPIFSAANALTAVGKTPDEIRDLELANLNGFRKLPGFWVIDWSFFLPDVDAVPGEAKGTVQPSYRIDAQLVDPLRSLPDHAGETIPTRRALSVLNLLRGWRFGLPSGQSVARILEFTPIPDAQLFSGDQAAVLDNFKEAFENNAPLWFYILKEAELQANGEHLGPVGGTIVAEVLTGLIAEDGQSFLSQWPQWKPTLPAKVAGEFTLSDLVNFAIA